MKTIAYLRVSKDSQDVKSQRLAILEFTQREKLEISEFMELNVSSRRSPKERQIDLLVARLESGDTLVVSELSRMGRSVGEIITTVDALEDRTNNSTFHAITPAAHPASGSPLAGGDCRVSSAPRRPCPSGP